MCISIKLSDGSEIETLGELRQRVRHIIFYGDAPFAAAPPDDNCLCWVDIEATCRGEGWGIMIPDHGMFAIATTPAPAPAAGSEQEQPRAAERM